MALRRPSDIGYDDTGYVLPPLQIRERIVESGRVSDALFPELGVAGIQGRLAARRGSLSERVAATANIGRSNGIVIEKKKGAGLFPDAPL